jgi:esterase/lipase
MKKSILFVLSLAFVSVLFAQKIEVREVSGKFRSGNKNALSTTVYHSDLKTVQKEFESLLKDYKGKTSTKKGELFGDNLLITSVSNNTIDVYAYFLEGKDGEIEVIAGFDLGGAFISSSMHQEQYIRIAQIMREFAIKLTEKSYAGFLKAEEKSLKEAEKEHEKMIKTKSDLEKQNQDYKKKIEQNEKEIEKMGKQIEENATKLNEQKSEFEKLKKGESKIK